MRDVTPPSQRERELVDADRDLNPLVGTPLRRRLRNFRAEPDNYIASLGGPLPYMRRLRQIELEIEQHERQLGEAWRELAESCAGDEGAFAARWRRASERWSFDAVNDLIDRHNRWYPAEARLPMDPRTRDFVRVNGRPYVREPLDARWILSRFPPDRAVAVA